MKKEKTTDEDLLRAVERDIQTANDYYDESIAPMIEEAVNIYEADEDWYSEKFPELSKRSKFTTKDVANAVEALMPDLMETFFGGDSVVTMNPTGAEDVEDSETMEELVQHQFMRQNKGYKLSSRWVKATLYKSIGVVKCSWDRQTENVTDEKTVTFDLNNPQDYEMYQATVEAINSGEITAGESKDFGNGLFRIEIKREREVVKKNQPRIDYMDASEFIFIPTNLDINETVFAAHKMTKTVSDLRKKQKEGLYKKDKVDAVLAKAPKDTNYSSSTDDTQAQDDITSYQDEGLQEARKPITVYECYGDYDMTGDGIVEPMIVTVSEGVVLRSEKNEYERHPFFPMTPLIEPDNILGKSITTLAADFQHLKIAMLRQVIINTALSNKPKKYYNSNVINGKYLAEDMENIPVNMDKAGNINNVIQQEQLVNIAPHTMSFIEYNDMQKQETVGVSTYSQGLSTDMNKSGTKGEAQILSNNGNKRVRMIARNMVETGFAELFEFMARLNTKFIDQEQVQRITGKQLNVNEDEFSEKIDVQVSVGLGFIDRDTNLRALNAVSQFFAEFSELSEMFMKSRPMFEKFRAQKAKMLEELGIRDVDTYLPTADEIYGKQQEGQEQPPLFQQIAQAQQQAGQAAQQQNQQEMQLEQQKLQLDSKEIDQKNQIEQGKLQLKAVEVGAK